MREGSETCCAKRYLQALRLLPSQRCTGSSSPHAEATAVAMSDDLNDIAQLRQLMMQ